MNSYQKHILRIESLEVLCFCLHAADISHSIKPWGVHYKFVELLFREFFKQGDREKQLGMEISPLCDRSTLHIPDSQISMKNDKKISFDSNFMFQILINISSSQPFGH